MRVSSKTSELLKADAGGLRDSAIGIRAVLEHMSGPIRYVTVAVLLERVLRATVASRPAAWDDVDLLGAAADALELQVRGTLVFVVSGHISPSHYRLM